ncbi:MAG: ATP-binding cassette domain-containing protein [Erysipelotrichales bacterium]|nr:MAG: ATP-binding cassette domain-containing protein [Erysipelotrichales bacterium]
MKLGVKGEHLRFCYQNRCIIEHTDFGVLPGEFCVIVGANGSGKSTLMDLLCGIVVPQEGEIRWVDEAGERIDPKSHVAYVQQNTASLHKGFPATALEVVLSALNGKKKWFSHFNNADKDKAMEKLKDVGMHEIPHAKLSSLSGGQIQRVFLAQALMSDPEAILLDEPTSSLDTAFSHTFFQLLKNINHDNGTTIIAITHDMALAREFADTVYCLEETSIVALDKNQIEEELSHRHSHPHREEDHGTAAL